MGARKNLVTVDLDVSVRDVYTNLPVITLNEDSSEDSSEAEDSEYDEYTDTELEPEVITEDFLFDDFTNII